MPFKRENILNSRKNHIVGMNCLIRNFAVEHLRIFPQFFGSLKADDVADGKYKNSSRKFTRIISRKVDNGSFLLIVRYCNDLAIEAYEDLAIKADEELF